ncbi:maestro heat-like repeat-containing protein family member 7 [Gallus gallus]|uniref:maestro heat-like repeat-containing protein family member 7 n=1 Tax=Gallus gallus TaxID=9031 RepID=UPI001AEAF591|nr:maestro heat-like repeat-containing protein family member 7 [Gallus gallus]XP_046792094.1 maestro heat-like repeat-containing protein family member 7 [Gallus gallus]
MERKPPKRPRVAWEESGAPRERKPPRQPYEVTEVQPLRADADWLPVYAVEKEAVDCIEAYVKRKEKDLVQKMQFLNCICLLCSSAIRKGLTVSLDIFSFLNDLPEHIEVLLCEEPREQLTTALRYHCMNAIAALSEAMALSESGILHLLNVCFNVIFYLLPTRVLNICLYNHTLSAMDNMLQIVLGSHPTSSVNKQLQSIFELLLSFTYSGIKYVRERAMERIWKLCGFTASSFRQQLLGKLLDPPQTTGIVLKTLEKTTADCSAEDKEYARIILDLVLKDPDTWLTDVPEILGFWRKMKRNSTSVQAIFLSVLDVLAGRFPRDVLTSVLTQLPHTDQSTTLEVWKMVLTLPESSERILNELYSILQDKELCRIATAESGLLQLTVPEILGSIHRSLERNSKSLQKTLFSLLDVLTIQFPKDVLRSVLTDLPQTDSTTLDMWSSVLPVLKTSEHILDELSNVLQDQRLCEIFNVTTAELGLLRLTVIQPTEENMQQLCQPARLQRLLKIESLPLLWLVLTGLVLLSERPETAGVIRALFPEVMETLRFASTPITLKVLNIFRNVMRNLGKRQASPVALQLAEKILPLFNHVSSEVREGSIRLFKDMMEAVVWCKKRNMKKAVRRGLLPLLFQMSDETPSVAQASGEALVACAKFLKWKELKHQAREENTVGIRMCLLQQDRRRVEGYLWQSLPYLEDSQASLRCEAVTFLGLAVQHSREQSEEMLNEICNALQPLEDDAHPAVRSLAAGTIQMLRHERQQAASARSRLAALCCWPCIAI